MRAMIRRAVQTTDLRKTAAYKAYRKARKERIAQHGNSKLVNQQISMAATMILAYLVMQRCLRSQPAPRRAALTVDSRIGIVLPTTGVASVGPTVVASIGSSVFSKCSANRDTS